MTLQRHVLSSPQNDGRETLASPNRMVWELFEALRRLCKQTQYEEQTQDFSAMRQDTALCIILSVQCIEVFFNIYFRVIASEPSFAAISERLLAALEDRRVGLDRKLKEWPRIAFGKGLDLSGSTGQRFLILKNLRHELMHFKSTHQTVDLPGIAMHGLVNITAYQALTAKSATEALSVVEGLLCEVFTLRGATAKELPAHLHQWTGIPPLTNTVSV